MEKFLGQWMPVLASEHGRTIDRLIVWTHWLMLVLFVIWGAYFLYVLWRFNAKRAPRASYHGAQTHVSTYAEAGVALVEVILLVGIIHPSTVAGSFLTVFVALALVNWPGMARLVRGQALALR